MDRRNLILVLLFVSYSPLSLYAHIIHIPSDSLTIQAGINGANHGDTVLVADGIYTGDGNRDIDFLGKAITVISQNGPDVTIIDCDADSLDLHRGFYFHNGELFTSILDGFTIKNGYSEGGGGIECNADLIIRNCIFLNNSATSFGGAITVGRWPMIINCVFSSNSAGMGGAIHCNHCGAPLLVNCILWNNYPNAVTPGSGSPQFMYCNIEGWGYWGEGNIEIEPLFRNPDSGDFHLMAVDCGDSVDSPCIDAGHPDSLDVLLDCLYGLGIERSDMGAYGGRNTAGPIVISDLVENTKIPSFFTLFQNYPNPFNPSTTISFDIPQEGSKSYNVNITIYDLRGKKVITLINSEYAPGSHSIQWDGRDESGQKVSSDIYLYTLSIGTFTNTKKMVLIE